MCETLRYKKYFKMKQYDFAMELNLIFTILTHPRVRTSNEQKVQHASLKRLHCSVERGFDGGAPLATSSLGRV
jgi:hypothetical protein